MTICDKVGDVCGRNASDVAGEVEVKKMSTHYSSENPLS